MRELGMDIKWITVQMFLSELGVFEVEIDSETRKKARCTCPTFMSRASCNHTRHVKRKMEDGDGRYAIRLIGDPDDDEAFDAMEDPKSFRDFVIRHAKVEVID